MKEIDFIYVFKQSSTPPCLGYLPCLPSILGGSGVESLTFSFLPSYMYPSYFEIKALTLDCSWPWNLAKANLQYSKISVL